MINEKDYSAKEVHGTQELKTGRLTLRRYCPKDATVLYKEFGTDPVMYEYSGWNPYASPEMAEETVQRYISSYDDPQFFGWAIVEDDALLGTIGAYDYKDDKIEVGFSIARTCWGRGYATEALKAVLKYLTDNERIRCVTAWCAADNIGSKRTLEKAGMRLVSKETAGLTIGDQLFDKLNYEFRRC